MNPEQITELFETMASGLRAVQNSGTQDIDASGVPAHARRPEPPKPPEPIDKAKLKEFFDPTSDKFDPEAAVEMIAQKNYGTLIGDVNMRSIRGMFGQFRDQLPDFKEHENEVAEALAKIPKPSSQLTEGDVLNTYFLVKGAKMTLKERQAAAAKASSTMPPSTQKVETKEPELSSVELEVADRMFRRIPDREGRIKEYRRFAGYDEGGVTVKVPVGGGKVE